MIFNQQTQSDESHRKASEPLANFLARGGDRTSQSRQIIEALAREYPSAHFSEIKNRLFSRSDREFYSAFFELFLNSVFKRKGYQVQVHPDVPNSSSKPDFLVLGDECKFYVEARLVSETGSKRSASERMLLSAIDQINKILHSTDYHLHLSVLDWPKNALPARAIARDLQAKLDSSNYNLLSKLLSEEPDQLPNWSYRCSGGHIVFQPLPIDPERRGKKIDRVIGSHMPPAEWSSSRERIKTALRKKSSKFGALSEPYLIAIRCDSFIDDNDVVEALYGQEAVCIPAWTGEETEIQSRFTRVANGAWASSRGFQFKRVSGVLACYELYPWSLPAAKWRFFPHPFANFPLGTDFDLSFPTALPGDDGYLHWNDGASPQSVLGAPHPTSTVP